VEKIKFFRFSRKKSDFVPKKKLGKNHFFWENIDFLGKSPIFWENIRFFGEKSDFLRTKSDFLRTIRFFARKSEFFPKKNFEKNRIFDYTIIFFSCVFPSGVSHLRRNKFEIDNQGFRICIFIDNIFDFMAANLQNDKKNGQEIKFGNQAISP
jgi:hypothetical protein